MEGGIWYTKVLEHKKNVATHSTGHRRGMAGDATQKKKSRGKRLSLSFMLRTGSKMGPTRLWFLTSPFLI